MGRGEKTEARLETTGGGLLYGVAGRCVRGRRAVYHCAIWRGGDKKGTAR